MSVELMARQDELKSEYDNLDKLKAKARGPHKWHETREAAENIFQNAVQSFNVKVRVLHKDIDRFNEEKSH